MAYLSRTVLAIISWALMAIVLATVGIAEATSDLPAPFVYLSDIDPRIQQDMRYASGNNFLGRVVEGYSQGKLQCILTRETALSLKKVQDALLKKDFSLKVYDCYRPARGVRDFIQWSHADGDQKMKQQYYPDYDKRDLFSRGFIATRSMHSRGNTVDLTVVPAGSAVPEFNGKNPLVRCDAPADRRLPDNSLDFGTGFDCFDVKSHTASTDIPQSARKHRQMLVDAMSAEGFENYRKEWWHFEKKGAATAEAFDFPVGAGQVRSENTDAPSTPMPLVPPAPTLVTRGCPLTRDISGLFSIDCNGKNVEITVLKDLSSRSQLGTIIDYDPSTVEQCVCEIATDNPPQGQEWCKIRYVKTVQQDFPAGWVLFAALQHPRQGSAPSCRRPPNSSVGQR